MFVSLPKELKVFIGLGEKLLNAVVPLVLLNPENVDSGDFATLAAVGLVLKMFVGGGGVVCFAAKIDVDGVVVFCRKEGTAGVVDGAVTVGVNTGADTTGANTGADTTGASTGAGSGV